MAQSRRFAKMRSTIQFGFVAIIVIVFSAFFVRVHKLGTDASFTTDEVTTVSNSMSSLEDMWRLENKTPLQPIWVRVGARILGFGYSEFAVFFMSVLTGVLTVAIVYRLGELLFERSTALLAAFMMAFSAYHIYWSRSARYYSLMVLLSSSAFLCLYQALTRNHRKAWLGYVLLRALGLYTHLTALWFWIGEILVAALFVSLPAISAILGSWKTGIAPGWPTGLRRNEGQTRLQTHYWPGKRSAIWFGGSMVLILAAFAPRWYPLIRDIYRGGSGLRLGGISSGQMDPSNPVTGYLRPVLGGGWRGPFLVLQLLDSWISPLHTIMLISLLAGLLFCILHRRWRQLFFILILMVTPFALTTTAKTYGIVAHGRHLISLLPLYYLLVSYGVSGLVRHLGRKAKARVHLQRWVSRTVSTLFALAFLGLSFTRIPLTYRNAGQNWRSVSEFLAQNAGTDQLIVVPDRPTLHQALQFYLPGFNVVGKDPYKSYDMLFQEEESLWLVFSPEIDMYHWLRYWADRNKAVLLIFRGGWYPDIDRATAVSPSLNWDLYVAYIDHDVRSADRALELQQRWLAQVEAHNPDDVRGHLTLAEAYSRFDRLEAALYEYTLALDEGYVNEQLASYIYDARGMIHSRLGETAAAMADWQGAIARAKWSDEPYRRLGDAYLQLGRPDATRALYQAAIAANPNKAWPHVLMGDFYQRLRQRDQAVAEYRSAIAIEADDQSAYQRLGEVYAADGENARIVALYEQAIQRNPWLGWPHFQLGQFYQSIGQLTKATSEYQRATELRPEYTPSVARFLRVSRWDLAEVLNLVDVYTTEGKLLWWPDESWVRPYPYPPERIVSRSALSVGERVRPNQLLLHPFGDEESTYVQFEIPDSGFEYLYVGYGLADEVAGRTNGVLYSVEIRTQEGTQYLLLFEQEVSENVWREQAISLASHWGEDLDIRLIVDALDDQTYDWLQTTVELIPPPIPAWNLPASLPDAVVQPSDGGLPRNAIHIAP